jgi:release factor glutamine methyltransferase
MTSGPSTVPATWRELWRSADERIGDRVQTRWLMEEASGRAGPALLRDLDLEAPPDAADRLELFVERRLGGEPLQHVLGHWGFRTLEVAVDSRVLVPRPETESVVTFALFELDRLVASNPAREALVVDLGTGSGVIALSIAAERHFARVLATDRDPAALEVAAANLSRLEAPVAARVELRQGDWYSALPPHMLGNFGLVVSNPPYLARHEWPGLEPAVRDFDPYGALVAGASGLEAIRVVVAGATRWLGREGAVVVEIAPHHAASAVDLAREAGFATAVVEDDLAGRPRVLVARR